jgi:hypothetical protein
VGKHTFKVDLNMVVYVSKLGKVYSLFVENTDEVAVRKKLIEKGISKLSKLDVATLFGNPDSPLSRTSGTNWGTVPESNLFESLDGITKNIVSVVRQMKDEGPPTARMEPVPTP